MRVTSLFIIVPFLAASCASTESPPFLDGLGDARRSVTTRSDLAQRYFDQGLNLCWAFNHDEAILSFEAATEADPECAMAWWGIAYALGPNLNNPLTDDEKSRRAHAAAKRAKALSTKATPLERALIAAICTRYADTPPKDRTKLDEAYAQAMDAVRGQYPGDADVTVLTADAYMLLNKEWRLLREDGNRGPHTPKVVAMLEGVLSREPNHPGACHFYIHSVEASTRPERALPVADRLLNLMPGAGHMVHMPSHIYIRVGMYEKSRKANEMAVDADDRYFEKVDRGHGVYHGYRAHNAHFQAWSSMFLGARKDALDAAREMVAKLPLDDMGEGHRLESYLFVPVHVMMRFGLWAEILSEPSPPERFPVAVALWHHARGVALANTGRIPEALEEEKKFEAVAASVDPEVKVRRATVTRLMDLARHMMKGEIRFKAGMHEEAFAALRQAVEIEDSLPYSEPPGWMQPIRHALGALLLEADRVDEAEAVYRADLARHADNGWSLHGLAECLSRKGKGEEAAAVQTKFEKAWAHSDIKITSSCFCRTAEGN